MSSNRLDRCKKLFEEADTDGNGYLTLQELTAMLRKNGYKTSETEIRAMFIAADTTGDNKISLEEYLVAVGELPEKDHLGAVMRRCFRSFDKNGDGKIDSAELDQVFREAGKDMSKEEIERMIQLMDKNKDGTVDYEEFIAEVFGK